MATACYCPSGYILILLPAKVKEYINIYFLFHNINFLYGLSSAKTCLHLIFQLIKGRIFKLFA